MNRPAMLVDVMWPLLSILEDNQDAPMREAIAWELQLADDGTDATLRLTYADRLHHWGCLKREADVRKEAARHPHGVVNVGTEDAPVYRDTASIAREIAERIQDNPGVVITLPNERAVYGEYAWRLENPTGRPAPDVERGDDAH